MTATDTTSPVRRRFTKHGATIENELGWANLLAETSRKEQQFWLDDIHVIVRYNSHLPALAKQWRRTRDGKAQGPVGPYHGWRAPFQALADIIREDGLVVHLDNIPPSPQEYRAYAQAAMLRLPAFPVRSHDKWQRIIQDMQNRHVDLVGFIDRWGRLLHMETSRGRTVADVALPLAVEAYGGMPSFNDLNFAVLTLQFNWIHGDELRRWHNRHVGRRAEANIYPRD